jgi:hypothetical protein
VQSAHADQSGAALTIAPLLAQSTADLAIKTFPPRLNRQAPSAALWHDSEPCTPLACTVVAKTVHESLAGLEAVVIGRSTIVGKRLAQLLIAAYRRHAEA